MDITYTHFFGRRPKSFAETYYPECSEQEAVSAGRKFWSQIEKDGYKITSMRVGLSDIIARITT